MRNWPIFVTFPSEKRERNETIESDFLLQRTSAGFDAQLVAKDLRDAILQPKNIAGPDQLAGLVPNVERHRAGLIGDFERVNFVSVARLLRVRLNSQHDRQKRDLMLIRR